MRTLVWQSRGPFDFAQGPRNDNTDLLVVFLVFFVELLHDHFGSDFMTIVDEDGQEYELEVLSTLELESGTYLAVIPAGLEEDEAPEVSILKSVEEDGEPILCAIEDEKELQEVYDRIMDHLYQEDQD